MNNFQYADIEKLIREYEEDARTIRSERMIMKNYSKVLTMSVASSFEYNIKNRCQDFYDNPKLSIAQNYPKINTINRNPIVDQMYNKIEAYNDDGIEHLSAEKFYDFFNGCSFKTRVQDIFVAERQQRIQHTVEQINRFSHYWEQVNNMILTM